MILNTRKNKPLNNPDRVRRLEWLIENKDKYKLGNYPWGLPRAPKGDPNRDKAIKRLNMEDAILQDMRDAGLFSEHTQNKDVNMNNLITDAMAALRHGRYVPTTATVS